MSLTPEDILKKVKRLEIRTRKDVSSVLSGQYHSRFKGHGMQFSEFREYYPGDDVRHIDWKVTARAQHPYTKLFEEERELTVLLAVDISASLATGSAERLKREAVLEACALLAFSAIKNNDRVGLLLFSDTIEKFVPPKKGLPHGMRIVRDLLYTEASSRQTNIAHALKFLGGVLKHSGIIVLASDFLDHGFGKALRILNRKNDIIALRVTDPVEDAFPEVGLVRFTDSETGEDIVLDTSSYAFRTQHEEAVKKHLDVTQRVLLHTGVDVVRLDPREDTLRALLAYFRRGRHA